MIYGGDQPYPFKASTLFLSGTSDRQLDKEQLGELETLPSGDTICSILKTERRRTCPAVPLAVPIMEPSYVSGLAVGFAVAFPKKVTGIDQSVTNYGEKSFVSTVPKRTGRHAKKWVLHSPVPDDRMRLNPKDNFAGRNAKKKSYKRDVNEKMKRLSSSRLFALSKVELRQLH